VLILAGTSVIYSGCSGCKRKLANYVVKLPEPPPIQKNYLADRNVQTMDSLAHLYAINPIRLKAIWGNAKTVTILSDSMYAYLQDIKETLARNAGGWMDESKNAIENDDDLVFPETYFVKQDSGKNGIELRNKLENFEKRMRDLAIDKTGKQVPLEMEYGFDTEKEKSNRDGKKIPWHVYYFEGVPAIAAITEITKFQNDIRNAESELLELLYKEAKKVQ
jgi:gliding motility-associated protein GldM